MTTTYPPAPWHSHGHAFAQSFLVDARSVRLPAGFEPVTIGGRALGVLAVIEYVSPSPLTYAELAWMPCGVRAGGKRGYFIEKMYVDSTASLAGGRELWAIPKQLATFAFAHRTVTIDTEDGAHLVLDLARRGPAVTAPVSSGTLQDGGDAIVRFRGSGTARVRSGGLRVREARGMDAWNGWKGARRLPGLGAAMDDFAITMHEPVRFAR